MLLSSQISILFRLFLGYVYPPYRLFGLIMNSATKVVNPGKGGIGPLGSWLAFIVSELAGGLLAAGLFRLTHRKELLGDTSENLLFSLVWFL